MHAGDGGSHAFAPAPAAPITSTHANAGSAAVSGPQPVYVNPRQYRRILIRRQARARLRARLAAQLPQNVGFANADASSGHTSGSVGLQMPGERQRGRSPTSGPAVPAAHMPVQDQLPLVPQHHRRVRLHWYSCVVVVLMCLLYWCRRPFCTSLANVTLRRDLEARTDGSRLRLRLLIVAPRLAISP